ncbi:MAG: SDR family oxidoreductase, partial [Mycobacteriales bacterium]
MILVAGGTGRLGALVVRRLADESRQVRVLTRDPARAAAVAGPLVDVVRGDVREAASLAPAVAGATTVVSAVHGFAGPGGVTPRSVDRDGNANLIDAAAAGGADVVLVSVVGAAPDHPIELLRMKAAAEERLRRSDVKWTIVRATAFIELYVELMRRSAAHTGRPLVFGRGTNPVNFVSVTDVATVVAGAATDSQRRGQVLEVGGPDNLTMDELAAFSQRELGSSAKGPRHVPRAMLRTLALTGRLRDTAIA